MSDSVKKMTLSVLPKTWILDLDGTIVKHNGYKIDGHDTLLDGAREFMNSLGKDDLIIFVTSRTKDVAEMTERFLIENAIHYDHIIYGAPYGERILVNDDKPGGLCMAYAFRKARDCGDLPLFVIDESL